MANHSQRLRSNGAEPLVELPVRGYVEFSPIYSYQEIVQAVKHRQGLCTNGSACLRERVWLVSLLPLDDASFDGDATHAENWLVHHKVSKDLVPRLLRQFHEAGQWNFLFV